MFEVLSCTEHIFHFQAFHIPCPPILLSIYATVQKKRKATFLKWWKPDHFNQKEKLSIMLHYFMYVLNPIMAWNCDPIELYSLQAFHI